jgi:hypothetical protein
MNVVIPSEHEEQAAFFTMVLYKYQQHPDFARMLFFAVPNGAWLAGRRPYAVMEKMKSEGFTPGVADVLYLQPRGKYAYLVIEMKRADKRNRKNGGLRDDQLEFLKSVDAAGGMSAVCWSAEDAELIFDTYMSLPAGPHPSPLPGGEGTQIRV